MTKYHMGTVYVICQGVLLSFFAHLGLIAFLMMTSFELSLPWLTTLLIATTFVVSMMIGFKSMHLWMVTGPLVGMFTIGMILAYLYLSAYVDMDIEMNLILILVYTAIGFLGSMTGHWLLRKKHPTTKKTL